MPAIAGRYVSVVLAQTRKREFDFKPGTWRPVNMTGDELRHATIDDILRVSEVKAPLSLDNPESVQVMLNGKLVTLTNK